MKEKNVPSGRCRYCKCVETRACMTPLGPCSWADSKETVCSNPDCMAKAKKDKVRLLPYMRNLYSGVSA